MSVKRTPSSGAALENGDETLAAWRELFANATEQRPLTRVLGTHMHPDHIGMAGWLTRKFKCQLWMTQLEYLNCRVLTADTGRAAPEDGVMFYRRAGWSDEAIEKYQTRFGNFGKGVHAMPDSYRRIRDGEEVRMGANNWRVIVGTGHSPEHACLSCEDLKLLISGDQVLPRISSNVSVHPTEPGADPMQDWLQSLAKMKREVPVDVLVLPSQNPSSKELFTRFLQAGAKEREAVAVGAMRCWRLQATISAFNHPGPLSMRSMKSGILFVGAASLLALAACNPDQSAKPAASSEKDTTVATVNGTVIGKNRVDMLVKQGAGSGKPDSAETRNAIIDQLAMQMVIAEEAIKKGLDKATEVTERLEMVRQSVLANAYVQDFIKNNPVSDEALKAEYERIKATVTGSQYKARHILVEKEAEARDIIAKLKKDAALFAKLAMEKSKDTGSKASGGDLGWFDLSRMVPEFGAAVSKLEKGKFTQEPVKSQFGYHVILLEDSKPIEAPPFEQVKPNLAQQLQQQNLKKQLDDLKGKAKIEIVGAPAAPASSAASAASAAK
ncbi:MAG: peptidylprolyl isomerase [Rhodoferax sp.]